MNEFEYTCLPCCLVNCEVIIESSGKLFNSWWFICIQMFDLTNNLWIRRRKFNYCWWGSKITASLIVCSWLMPRRASGQQKLASIPMDRHLPDGDCSTSGRVNPCVTKSWQFIPGQMSNPSVEKSWRFQNKWWWWCVCTVDLQFNY